MQIVRSVLAMQRISNGWKRQGLPVAFVPTMGYLHAGHLSLIKRARRLVGKSGKVVVSIYVNPTQFGPKEDFSRYPRDLHRDIKSCRAEGVNVVFAPSNNQMYPSEAEEKYSTFVVEEQLSRGMEGAARPSHFRGVTTIVAKLLNIVRPDVAVFGTKDYQQAAIIKRMVRDLNFPLKIVVAPTFREPDGLAMSSRNKYLSGDLRRQATVLSRCLQQVKTRVTQRSQPIPGNVLKKQVRKIIESEPDARLDYVEFFQGDTLAPLSQVSHGAHMALAVFIGRTRLIDNAPL